jgi:hypothetical protein
LPPGLRIYPSEFREMLAKLPDLPNALFHRDEQGRTINERPSLRVAGATGWVGLVANEGSEKLLRDAVGPAVMAVSQRTGHPCSVQIEELDFAIKSKVEPTIYWVREMAIKRKGPQAVNQDIESLIADRMRTSIAAVCAQAGMECPSDEQLGIQTVEVVHQRGLRLQATTGITNMWVTLVDARVMIHAELKGMWFVGNLTARGYGRVIAPRPGMRFDAERKADFLQ